MIIQVLLVALLAGIFLYAVSQRRRAFAPAMVMAGVAMVGTILVLAPELANKMAHLVGVGRGADLILYCFVMMMLVAMLNIHLRLRSEREVTTELARAIAILAAKKPERRK